MARDLSSKQSDKNDEGNRRNVTRRQVRGERNLECSHVSSPNSKIE